MVCGDSHVVRAQQALDQCGKDLLLSCFEYDNCQVTYRGRSGAGLKDGLQMVRDICSSGRQTPDCIILHLGTNDIVPKSRKKEHRKTSKQLRTFFLKYINMIKELCDAWNISLIYSCMLPHRHYYHMDSNRAANRQRKALNGLVRSICQVVTRLLIEPSVYNNYFLEGDDVHLSHTGYVDLVYSWHFGIQELVDSGYHKAEIN